MKESHDPTREAAIAVATLHNPYDYANPVRDPRLFAGRNGELSRIAYCLDQAGPADPVGYIALYGQRAAGKTSLLNKVEVMARERGCLTVRVNLVPGDATPTAFFGKLYEELVGAVCATADLTTPDGRKITPRAVRRVVNGADPGDDLPLEFPESLSHARSGGRMSELALRTDLRLLSEQVGRTIVLLIDEAQIIARDEDVLSTLRTVGMQLQGYVFVLAGTAELLHRVNEVFDHLLRQFVLVKVERFAESSEVLECVTRPLEALGLDADSCFERLDATVNELSQLTDNNPYAIQLYCYVMFSRWQAGAAERMTLSPETMEEVHALMEAGREGRHRPLITAVRRMDPERLTALNVLCSSLGHATVDEIWFAHCVAMRPVFSKEKLYRYRDEFVSSGLVEVADGIVRLPDGVDPFEEIYTRLWTLRELEQKDPSRGGHALRHLQLTGRLDFRHLLAQRLSHLLCELDLDPARELTTCCYGMHPSHLEAGLTALDSLPRAQRICFTVPYLHQAILRSGMPKALDITTVECGYRGTTAVRWLYSPDSADFDLASHPSFVSAAGRLTALGGTLRAERTRTPLKSWPEILDWLVAVCPEKDRKTMAQEHVKASLRAFGSGDTAGATAHLTSAYTLAPGWEVANNLAYLALAGGRDGECLRWAEQAIGLARRPRHRALSRYNAAIAKLRAGDLDGAGALLSAAGEDLASLPDPRYRCGYLVVPRLNDDRPVFCQEEEVDLGAAVSIAREITDLLQRYRRLRGRSG